MLPESIKPLILICDDEEAIRESLKLILSDDYALHFVKNGLEAMQGLEKIQPRLMILDIRMPKIHGMEILKQVKRTRPSLPIIIVTGYQSVELAQEALKNGAADYIPKPFNSKQILKAVAKIILPAPHIHPRNA